MAKAKVPTFEYYEAASMGTHTFFAAGLEYMASALEIKTGRKCGFHAFLPRSLDDFEAIAADMGGVEIPWLMEGFPMRGLNFLREGASKRKPKVVAGKRDVVYSFSGICKNPVYVGTFGIITQDYGRPMGVFMNYIIASSEADANAFLAKFFECKRERNRSGCVLNATGELISEFRQMEWDNIFLSGNMVGAIREEIDMFFGSKQMYDEHGLDWRRGLLLAGPPGNGKTAVCRAIATSAKVPVVYCALNEGDMFGILNAAAITIGQNAPCIAIFEDADAVGVDEALRSAMLNMLDGLFTCDGVFTLATTNCPDKLDNAFTGRPSRFDSYYVIQNPPLDERKKILLSRLGKKAATLKQSEVDGLVDDMEGLSAACVQEIAACSLMASFKARKPMSIKMLRESLDKVKIHMKASKDGSDKWLRGSVGFGAVLPHPEDY